MAKNINIPGAGPKNLISNSPNIISGIMNHAQYFFKGSFINARIFLSHSASEYWRAQTAGQPSDCSCLAGLFTDMSQSASTRREPMVRQAIWPSSTRWPRLSVQ